MIGVDIVEENIEDGMGSLMSFSPELRRRVGMQLREMVLHVGCEVGRQDARRNAQQNSISNTEFIAGAMALQAAASCVRRATPRQGKQRRWCQKSWVTWTRPWRQNCACHFDNCWVTATHGFVKVVAVVDPSRAGGCPLRVYQDHGAFST